MIILSVNINKIALIRNSRGHNYPNLLTISDELIKCGAQGITIHPRPDERHARYQDAYELKKHLPKTIELNIEGYPNERFLDMVCQVQPAQCTLVPDAPDAITSNAGWDCQKNQDLLTKVIKRLKQANIRTSIFLDANPDQVSYAATTGTDRIELYTESYAKAYTTTKLQPTYDDYCQTAVIAHKHNLQVNAGHDLNLENLAYFAKLPYLSEVSIGHALIVDMLHLGMAKTIKLYRKKLQI